MMTMMLLSMRMDENESVGFVLMMNSEQFSKTTAVPLDFFSRCLIELINEAAQGSFECF